MCGAGLWLMKRTQRPFGLSAAAGYQSGLKSSDGLEVIRVWLLPLAFNGDSATEHTETTEEASSRAVNPQRFFSVHSVSSEAK